MGMSHGHLSVDFPFQKGEKEGGGNKSQRRGHIKFSVVIVAPSALQSGGEVGHIY